MRHDQTKRGTGVALLLTVLALPALIGMSGPVSAGELAERAETCSWSSDYVYSYIDYTGVSTFVQWDDGSGPALYVGGTTPSIGNLTVNGVAKWDGSSWQVLAGASGVGVETNLDPYRGVSHMVVYDQGDGPALYVAGNFRSAGGLSAYGIARWDGWQWSAVLDEHGAGTELSSSIWVMTVFDDGTGPALYAGGNIKLNGSSYGLARWDGVSWAGLASGAVLAMTEWNDGSGPALYGGGYSTLGDTGAYLARWDGASWIAVPNGPNYVVHTLQVWDDGTGAGLYVGGRFTNVGGKPVQHIARWDGSSWSELGAGANSWVYAMSVYDDGTGAALYVAGSFDEAGDQETNHVARWDGTVWSRVGVVGVPDGVSELMVYNNGSGEVLLAAGIFQTADKKTASRIAQWSGEEWSALCPSNGVQGPVYAMASRWALHIGGEFEGVGGFINSQYHGVWNGSEWTGGGSAPVRALAFFNDGSGWSIYDGGDCGYKGCLRDQGQVIEVEGRVDALVVHDDGNGEALYAGGQFLTADSLEVNYIARWDGSQWSALTGPSGTGTDSWVEALAVYDDGNGEALYAGGRFLTAGGVTVNYIARWFDGEWSALTGSFGTGTDFAVKAMAVFDDGSGSALYVGGEFTTAGGVTVNRIARWDGSEWSALSGASGTGVGLSSVNALTAWDDGRTGNALYVGGDFVDAGGVTVGHLARWDGSAWTSLSDSSGTGLDGPVHVLHGTSGPDGATLYVGGAFAQAGGHRSDNIAAWSCLPLEIFSDGFESGDTLLWNATVN